MSPSRHGPSSVSCPSAPLPQGSTSRPGNLGSRAQRSPCAQRVPCLPRSWGRREAASRATGPQCPPALGAEPGSPGHRRGPPQLASVGRVQLIMKPSFHGRWRRCHLDFRGGHMPPHSSRTPHSMGQEGIKHTPYWLSRSRQETVLFPEPHKPGQGKHRGAGGFAAGLPSCCC